MIREKWHPLVSGKGTNVGHGGVMAPAVPLVQAFAGMAFWMKSDK